MLLLDWLITLCLAIIAIDSAIMRLFQLFSKWSTETFSKA
jgi:hypothetical protein